MLAIVVEQNVSKLKCNITMFDFVFIARIILNYTKIILNYYAEILIFCYFCNFKVLCLQYKYNIFV